MSYDFTSPSGGFTVDQATAVFSNTTLAAWFKWSSATPGTLGSFFAGGTLIFQNYSNLGNNYSASANNWYFITRHENGVINRTTLGARPDLKNSGWHLMVWVIESNASSVADVHRVYIDGVRQSVTRHTSGNAGTNFAFTDPVGCGIQHQPHSTDNDAWDDELAEWAMWDVPLTDAQIKSLYYVPANRIERENLVWYLPLLRDSRDHVEGSTWTSAGSPTAISDHPPITMYQQPIVIAPGGGGVVTPPFMDGVMTEEEWWLRRRKQFWHRKVNNV